MLFPKKSSERVISQEGKREKFGEIIFFDEHLKRNALLYIKACKSNKEILVIFMRKWVYLYFRKNAKYDDCLY